MFTMSRVMSLTSSTLTLVIYGMEYGIMHSSGRVRASTKIHVCRYSVLALHMTIDLNNRRRLIPV